MTTCRSDRLINFISQNIMCECFLLLSFCPDRLVYVVCTVNMSVALSAEWLIEQNLRIHLLDCSVFRTGVCSNPRQCILWSHLSITGGWCQMKFVLVWIWGLLKTEHRATDQNQTIAAQMNIKSDFQPIAIDPVWRSGSVIMVSAQIDCVFIYDKLPECSRALQVVSIIDGINWPLRMFYWKI